MTVFVDTSAVYALIDGDDDNHARAAAYLRAAPDSEQLVTHNCVVVEAVALVQSRLGMEATTALLEDVLPMLEIQWVGERMHRAAVASLLTARRRHLSLVDWISFGVMRERGIVLAFAFDDDFRAEGFTTVPGASQP